MEKTFLFRLELSTSNYTDRLSSFGLLMWYIFKDYKMVLPYFVRFLNETNFLIR